MGENWASPKAEGKMMQGLEQPILYVVVVMVIFLAWVFGPRE